MATLCKQMVIHRHRLHAQRSGDTHPLVGRLTNLAGYSPRNAGFSSCTSRVTWCPATLRVTPISPVERTSVAHGCAARLLLGCTSRRTCPVPALAGEEIGLPVTVCQSMSPTLVSVTSAIALDGQPRPRSC